MKELIAECRARIALIESTRDDGLFARRYAEDVPKLIAEIERLQSELDFERRPHR